MRIVITGHRPKSLKGGYNYNSDSNMLIRSWIHETLRSLRDINNNIETCSGMALGADQMFSIECIAMGLSHTAFMPCQGQDSVWPNMSRELHKDLLSKCSEVITVHDGPYTRSCMQERNEAMRDWALRDPDGDAVLMAVWSGVTTGGTWNMVDCSSSTMKIIRYTGDVYKC